MSVRKVRNQNRYTRKQEERRKCDALLQTADSSISEARRLPSTEESMRLLEGVRKNRISDFGLVKLSHLKLDGLVQTGNGIYQSLILYAVECGKDKIAIALLRAGADPIVCKLTMDECKAGDSDFSSSHNMELLSQVKFLKPMTHQFRVYPGAYVIWLIRFAQQRLQSSLLRCDLCGEVGVDYLPFKCYDTIKFDLCNHIVCNACYWNNIHLLDCGKDSDSNNANGDVMFCAQVEQLISENIYCLVCNNCTEVAKPLNNSCNIFNLTPAECKSESYNRWSELSVTFGVHHNHNNKSISVQIYKHKEQISCAMHLSQVAMLNLGCSQQQRNEELLIACEGRCNASLQQVRRIIHLIAAGIDIDCVNEYGLTPLHVAAWLGHVYTVRLLLAAGANASVCDPLGVRAFDAARAAGHMKLYQLLERHSLETSCVESIRNSDIIWADINIIAVNNDAAEDLTDSRGLHSLFRNEFIFALDNSELLPTDRPTLTVIIPPKAIPSSLPIESDQWLSKVDEYWSSIVSGANYHGAELGAFCFDDCFSSSFLHHLLYDVLPRLPVALCEKKDKEKAERCAERSFFCDLSGKVVHTLQNVIYKALHAQYRHCIGRMGEAHSCSKRAVKVFPQLRFLHYRHGGSALPPHVDLARQDVTYSSNETKDSRGEMLEAEQRPCTSTHTLILYLSDCEKGGETALLRSISKPKGSCDNSSSSRYDDSDIDAATATAFAQSGDLASISPRVGRLLLFPHKCPHEGLAIYSSEPKILLRGEVYIDASMYNS